MLIFLWRRIPVVNNLPQLDAKTFRKLSASRVVIKDQWASHPSTEDRAEHLQQLNINTEAVNLTAWSILRDPEAIFGFNSPEYEQVKGIIIY